VSIIGIAQPFNDAIKLFSKEIIYPYLSNITQYVLSPLCALLIVLRRCFLIPLKEGIQISRITVIFLYIILRINIYPVLISG
jgi:NADH:ubiquinone oxidoreductase subunit H